MNKIYNSEISNIKKINESIKSMRIFLDYNFTFDSLYKIQELFPNLENINIVTYDQIFGGNAELQIKEKYDCKIKNIKINLAHYYGVKFYCALFDKLESIEINYKENENNDNDKYMEDFFPLFNSKCDIIFKSLTIFNFKMNRYMSKNFMNNIFNNLNNMPNLINFKLESKIKEEIKEDFYNNFIIKILLMKYIRIIDICFKQENSKNLKYSKEELNKLCPNIIFDHLYTINIIHLK